MYECKLFKVGGRIIQYFFIQIPFMTEEVLNIFDNEGTSNEQNLFSQILMLYYILFYQYTYFRNLKQLHE